MRFLSNKEKKSLFARLPKGFEFTKKDEITQKENVIFKNKKPFLFIFEDEIFPHLKSIDDENRVNFPTVHVDKGAIPFLLNGADMMRPGIQKISEDVEKEKMVLICDEDHNKILGVGISLFGSEELKKQEKGKSIKVLHYVGDNIY